MTRTNAIDDKTATFASILLSYALVQHIWWVRGDAQRAPGRPRTPLLGRCGGAFGRSTPSRSGYLLSTHASVDRRGAGRDGSVAPTWRFEQGGERRTGRERKLLDDA